MKDTANVRGIAVLGNHLPRRCGIATFTTHLTDGVAAVLPEADCFVLAMNDAGQRHDYPDKSGPTATPSTCTTGRRTRALRSRRGVFAICSGGSMSHGAPERTEPAQAPAG